VVFAKKEQTRSTIHILISIIAARAPPASIVRFGDDIPFQILACGEEMVPAAVRSADGGAYGRVRPHQHYRARDRASAARFIEEVLEDFYHLRSHPN
jgi:hypothetical protein